ncbi:MAG TPA: ABC transporter permease [Dehalococcoidales bacterium]|nr:ABC transporter permease [Dehalococcoidales bacterium]
MGAFIVRRLLMALLVLILVTILVFMVIRFLPLDPITLYVIGTGNMDEARIQFLNHQYGLDRPLYVQYFSWISKVVRGDFGYSLVAKDSVSTLLKQRVPVTMYLGIVSMIISTVVGITIGMLAAIRRGKWLDNIVSPLSVVLVCLPSFLLGIFLIYIFGMKAHWLPFHDLVLPWQNFTLSIRQVIMPAICMSALGLAMNARQMRSSMLEIIRQDYVRTAWSKGLTERIVILKHALKNSLIPVVTLVGMGVGVVFAGAVITETIFSIPGMGRLFVTCIQGQDYIVVQDLALIFGSVILLVNLLVDISYSWIDPRIRYD